MYIKNFDNMLYMPILSILMFKPLRFFDVNKVSRLRVYDSGSWITKV